jgi:hypothetical protein
MGNTPPTGAFICSALAVKTKSVNLNSGVRTRQSQFHRTAERARFGLLEEEMTLSLRGQRVPTLSFRISSVIETLDYIFELSLRSRHDKPRYEIFYSDI